METSELHPYVRSVSASVLTERTAHAARPGDPFDDDLFPDRPGARRRGDRRRPLHRRHRLRPAHALAERAGDGVQLHRHRPVRGVPAGGLVAGAGAGQHRDGRRAGDADRGRPRLRGQQRDQGRLRGTPAVPGAPARLPPGGVPGARRLRLPQQPHHRRLRLRSGAAADRPRARLPRPGHRDRDGCLPGVRRRALPARRGRGRAGRQRGLADHRPGAAPSRATAGRPAARRCAAPAAVVTAGPPPPSRTAHPGTGIVAPLILDLLRAHHPGPTGPGDPAPADGHPLIRQPPGRDRDGRLPGVRRRALPARRGRGRAGRQRGLADHRPGAAPSRATAGRPAAHRRAAPAAVVTAVLTPGRAVRVVRTALAAPDHYRCPAWPTPAPRSPRT
ncbi:hypothetical protein SGPA1_50426 [Streptomyces misionensis JCM 4497]